MDVDDLLPKTPSDPLAMLLRQDLDRLSVDELTARVAALEAEIARSKARIATATDHRSLAEGIFRR